ncbi:hypothetical protein Pint_09461 [Pistacia integerrima]|uniref:Uncharacterized protein n=1 Tax=Pistacia integerrima TaxID=434235 RepID=A0ACC0XJ12_9ROSI|nr:hypothetical protein Pint_09461 [Pistacia integerrima]
MREAKLKHRIIDIPRIYMLFVAVVLAILLAVYFGVELFLAEPVKHGSIKRLVFSKQNTTAIARKLLQSPGNSASSSLLITPYSLLQLSPWFRNGLQPVLLFINSKLTRPSQAHWAGLLDDGDGNRIGTACSKDDIVIFQGSTAPLPNGIPSYTVQILNVCVSGCSISDIHVSCGWFSSARLINPRVFRRVYYDDCLVNDGEPLGPGETLSFQYANSFRYPLTISNVACC